MGHDLKFNETISFRGIHQYHDEGQAYAPQIQNDANKGGFDGFNGNLSESSRTSSQFVCRGSAGTN